MIGAYIIGPITVTVDWQRCDCCGRPLARWSQAWRVNQKGRPGVVCPDCRGPDHG